MGKPTRRSLFIQKEASKIFKLGKITSYIKRYIFYYNLECSE